MRIPILIHFIHQIDYKFKKLNFKILNNLDFRKVNLKKFPLMRILKILPEKTSLFETILVSINDN